MQWVWPRLADLLEADCSSTEPAGAAAGETLSALTMLGQVMAAEHMKQLFRMATFASGSLAAGVGAAARIVRALPYAPPPSLPREIWGLAHVAAATFLGLAAYALLSQPGARALQLQLTAEQEEGPSTFQEPAAKRQLQADAAEALEAAWAVLRVLPHAAAVLTRLTTSSLGDARDDCAFHLALALQLLQILPNFDGVSQAADWLAASRAMLRLLPLLGQLNAQSGQGEAAGAQPDSWQLADAVLTHLWQFGSSNVLGLVHSHLPRSQSVGDSLAQLAELATCAHTAACRTMHALAASAAGAGGPSGLWRQDSAWSSLAAGMNECLAAVFVAQDLSGNALR